MARQGDDPRPLIYFLCVGNAMRSQMAEGFLRAKAGRRFAVASAGTHPAGVVFPEVVTAMSERGIDISSHTSDPIDPELVAAADRIIDLGGRASSVIPRPHHEKLVRWVVEDPYGSGMDSVRDARDLIEHLVDEFLSKWPA